MNRVKIDIPEKLPFSTRMSVRITDLNYGNHVGNPIFLSLAHEARMLYLKSMGYSELNIENVSLIMADAAIEFKAELLYGDEVNIEVGLGGHSRVGFDLLYRITGWRNGESFLAAKIKTGLICYDYTLKKTVALPAAALLRMQQGE